MARHDSSSTCNSLGARDHAGSHKPQAQPWLQGIIQARVAAQGNECAHGLRSLGLIMRLTSANLRVFLALPIVPQLLLLLRL